MGTVHMLTQDTADTAEGIVRVCYSRRLMKRGTVERVMSRDTAHTAEGVRSRYTAHTRTQGAAESAEGVASRGTAQSSSSCHTQISHTPPTPHPSQHLLHAAPIHLR